MMRQHNAAWPGLGSGIARAWLAVAAAGVAIMLLALVACGSSGVTPAAPSAQPSASGSVHAYVSCLFQHLGSNGGIGARKACQALRPASGLGPVLRAFAHCLQSHGAVLPSQSPGTSAGDALRYLGQFASGTSSQRAAFGACESSA
jgi:hypothetical protein